MNLLNNSYTISTRTAKAQLELRFGIDLRKQMHEAFASGIGHAFSHPTNAHANVLKEAFQDGYYKLIDKFIQSELDKEL